MRLARKILFWLTGSISALMWAAAQIGPEEAASNISEWLSLVGISHIPPWLSNKSADTWVFWIGLIVFILWVVGIIIWFSRPKLNGNHIHPYVEQDNIKMASKRPRRDLLTLEDDTVIQHRGDTSTIVSKTKLSDGEKFIGYVDSDDEEPS